MSLKTEAARQVSNIRFAAPMPSKHDIKGLKGFNDCVLQLNADSGQTFVHNHRISKGQHIIRLIGQSIGHNREHTLGLHYWIMVQLH